MAFCVLTISIAGCAHSTDDRGAKAEGGAKQVQHKAPAKGEDTPPLPSLTYFYDVNTKQLFVADFDAIPPIAAPSGEGAGVRAHVMSCGDCSKPEDQFIGYLSRYSDDARRIMLNADKHTDEAVDKARREGQLVRMIDGEVWLSWDSKEANVLKHRLVERCGKRRLMPCYP